MFLPVVLISLEIIILPSIAFSFSGSYIHNSINEFVSPLRIISLEKRPPEIISIESIINVLPAPVSPVNTFSPPLKSMLKSSIIPIFFMCNVVIIRNYLLEFLFVFIIIIDFYFVNSFLKICSFFL